MKRTFNVVLVVAAIVGLFLLVQQRNVLAQLREEHDQLSAKYGTLDIRDRSKFYVLRLETDDPHDFLWRVYRPNVNQLEQRMISGVAGGSSGSSTSSSGLGELDSIHRYRLTFEDRIAQKSRIEVHRLTGTGRGRMDFGDPILTSLLKEHWDELDIQTLEDGEYDTDQTLRFLTIRVPGPLVEELAERRSHYDRLAEEPLLEIVVGTPAAFKKSDQEKGE